MSCMVAPPFARQGLPKNPWRNRRTRSPPRLSTRAVGTARITYMANVATYGTFPPNSGISLIGEKINGPNPSISGISRRLHVSWYCDLHPMTYKANPNEALNSATPNLAITCLLLCQFQIQNL